MRRYCVQPGEVLVVFEPPNNSFEPTPVSNAPSLRVGSGAAQLNR
jgi:hypothetical protein